MQGSAPLDRVPGTGYSFPINLKYRNSVAFSGVQAGLLIAYSSSNMVIVLLGGKQIAAILHGHHYEVCTVAFETRGAHIVSCDMRCVCIFWHYQEPTWHQSRTVRLPYPATCISWFSSRREISFSSRNGLTKSSIAEFGQRGIRLCPRSSFCRYNYDGSLLCSHDFGRALTVVSFVPQILIEVIPHPTNI
jgi:hypothetical protein